MTALDAAKNGTSGTNSDTKTTSQDLVGRTVRLPNGDYGTVMAVARSGSLWVRASDFGWGSGRMALVDMQNCTMRERHVVVDRPSDTNGLQLTLL